MYARKLLPAAIVLSSLAGPAAALTETEANAGIQFSFANPGARSMAMGGAFIGLADDATAAYSNPAGLNRIALPEISGELRHSSFDTPHVDGGAARLSPFDLSGVGYSRAESEDTGLSFLSAAFPDWPVDALAVAFYRAELARFSTDYSAASVELLDPGRGDLRAFASDVDLRIVNYGASASYEVNDRFAIGLGLSLYDFEFDTRSNRFRRGTTEVASTQVQDGDDQDFAFTLGTHWVLLDDTEASRRMTLGAVYRQGPKFEYSGSNTIRLDASNNPVNPPTVQLLDGIGFDVPDAYGLGLAYQSGNLTLNFDVLRIEYSSLAEGVRSILTSDPENLAALRIDDGTELRLGGEYTWDGRFSLRAGAWRDPAHSLQFDTSRVAPGPQLSGLSVLFSTPADDEMHYSIGAGLLFERFQVDFAADFSELVDTYSLSTVWRF